MNCTYIAAYSANIYTQPSIDRRLLPCREATYSELLFHFYQQMFQQLLQLLYHLVFFNSQHPSPAPLLFAHTTTYVAA